MDVKKYQDKLNALKYPQRSSFSETFYYEKGNRVDHVTAIKEVVFDDVAYRNAVNEYNVKNMEIKQAFRDELAAFCGVVRHPKFNRFMELCIMYSDETLEGIYNVACDLSDLMENSCAKGN